MHLVASFVQGFKIKPTKEKESGSEEDTSDDDKDKYDLPFDDDETDCPECDKKFTKPSGLVYHYQYYHMDHSKSKFVSFVLWSE